MSSIYGRRLRVSVFGQSHSTAIGVTLDGFPAGYMVDEDELSEFMARRAPGRDRYSTPRREANAVEFISGISDGYTCGATITAIIRNTNTRPSDYCDIPDVPRPSHADYTSLIKYGPHADFTGGGHFSGRLTAPLCVAGALSLGLLRKQGVNVSAFPVEIGGISGTVDEMREAIDAARKAGDSVGGIVECCAEGVPAGLGDPMFDGMENRIAAAVFGIPAVRGIEFGAGFAAARMRGSDHNDAFVIDGSAAGTATNRHGGILGGITSGMPVVFRVAMKPTPSIALEQDSVSLSRMEPVKLSIKGRHDPCIVLRAVPCIESACAIALLDAWLESGIELRLS